MRRSSLIALVLLAGCAARATDDQMEFLLDELTIVREELKKYPPQIHALEQQVRGQRRILREEIRKLREQVARLEQRLQARGSPTSRPTAADKALIDPYAAGSRLATGVRRLGPGHWRVRRSAITRTGLLRSARIVPAMQAGKPEGFKLYAIRPGSLLWRMGLRNGDVVLRVNGKHVTRPDEALRVYSMLRHARKVELTIRRRGKERILRYTLVP